MSKWDTGERFIDRARKAVGDDLMQDIVRDRLRVGLPAAIPDTPPRAEAKPLLSYVEWAAAHGHDWSPERARHEYLTKLTAGKDLEPVREQPRWVDGGWVDTYSSAGVKAVPQRGTGWYEPAPVRNGFNPIIEQLIDQQDRFDRAALERKLKGGR